MNESIDRALADQAGQRCLVVPIAGNHDHQIGKLTLDLCDEQDGGLTQRLYIQNQDTDAAGDQQVAYFIRGGDVPEAPRRPHGLTQRLQENVVPGEHDQLHDVAREAEP